MKFGSVCSGIEAASVAWHPLGWSASWLAEIEPFPCAVLAHHYPDVPNLGDMTTIRSRIDAGEVEAPDLLCGGTPCQAFSVAGLRQSLADERGNLSLEFIRIADAIDRVRCAAGKQPAWVVWENVPGVLSTSDNAFGAFLGGLCGADSAIPAPAAGWPRAGVVDGPSRVVAWRVLDAQYFGLAQRRQRVFVLALGGARAWDCADALLPVSDSMLWHPAPSREARAGVAVGALAGTSPGGGWRVGADEAAAGQLVAFGGNNRSGSIDVAAGLNAKGGAGRMDFDSETFIAHSLRGEGFDASEDGTGRGTPLVPVAFAATDYETGAFERVDAAGPLTTSADRTRSAPILAFSAKDHGADAAEDIAPTLRAGGHAESHANAGVMPAIAFQTRGSNLGVGDVSGTIGCNSGSASGSAPMAATSMQVRRLTPLECERLQGFPDGYTAIPSSKRNPALESREMRQYFIRTHQLDADDPTWPEQWKRMAADGPRYKALGNSWAVPCARWIGQRIQLVSESA